MDADQVATLQTLLAHSGWLERARDFGASLRTTSATRSPGGLLLVGTPTFEPWHLTAHLSDEALLGGLPALEPTLVRWAPPRGAPAHLAVGLQRLEEARRGEALFVVASDAAPVPLLERVSDARRAGATIFALDQGDPELDGLAHEFLPAAPVVSFDATQHLVSAAAGDRAMAGGTLPRQRSRTGFRDRLARLLDAVSGPTAG